MRWVLISKKQLFDKDGSKEGVLLLLKSGRSELKYIVSDDTKKFQIGFVYQQGITLKLMPNEKRSIQDTLDIIIKEEEE